MLAAIGRALLVAAAAPAVGTVIATMAARATSGPRFRQQAGFEAMIGLPLIVPDIVAGIATLLFFVMVGVPLGIVSIMLAHTVFAIPFAYLPIRARLNGLDPALAEAAADLYATPWRSFRPIVFPLIWPAIPAGAMLPFITSLAAD